MHADVKLRTVVLLLRVTREESDNELVGGQENDGGENEKQHDLDEERVVRGHLAERAYTVTGAVSRNVHQGE